MTSGKPETTSFPHTRTLLAKTLKVILFTIRLKKTKKTESASHEKKKIITRTDIMERNSKEISPGSLAKRRKYDSEREQHKAVQHKAVQHKAVQHKAVQRVRTQTTSAVLDKQRELTQLKPLRKQHTWHCPSDRTVRFESDIDLIRDPIKEKSRPDIRSSVITSDRLLDPVILNIPVCYAKSVV